MPDEADQRNFQSPRSLNRRPRYAANLTIPQLGALAGALTIGAGLWWLLGVLPLFAGTTLGLIALRLLVPGALAGALAVLFYALADDLREPTLRQLVLFSIHHLLRRHNYEKESQNGHDGHPGRHSRYPGRPRRSAGGYATRGAGARARASARAGARAAGLAATRAVAPVTAAVAGVARRARRPHR